MAPFLATVADYLMRQSWQLAAVFVLVAAACWGLRKKSAHWRYLLWLVVLAKCLIPAPINVPLAVSPSQVVPLSGPKMQSQEVPIGPHGSFPAATTVGTSQPASDVNRAVAALSITSQPEAVVRSGVGTATAISITDLTWRAWLALAWLAGIGLFVGYISIRAWATHRRLSRTRRGVDGETATTVAALARKLGMRTIPPVYVVDCIAQPFVWGWLRGSIYLPQPFIGRGTRQQRQAILTHELAHVARRDAAVNLVQILVQAVFFFHPFVWLANRQIRREREKCCYEMVIAGLGANPKQYGEAIVSALVAEYQATQGVPSLAVAGRVNNIEQRIQTILSPNRRFYRRPSPVAVATAMLAAAVALPTALVPTVRGSSPDSQSAGTSPHVSAPASPAAGASTTAESTTAKQDEVQPQSEQVEGPKDGLAIDVTVVGIDGKPADQCQAITVWEKIKAATEIRSGDYTSTDPRDGTIWRRVCEGSFGRASNHYFTGNTRPLPPGVYRVTAFVGAQGEKMLGMAISDPLRLDGSQGTTLVRVPVEDGPPVAFTIVDANTGAPVHYPPLGIRLTRPDGFDVQLDPLNPGLFSGSDGKYRIEHLAPGRYHVDVSARTYAYGYPDYQLGKPIAIDVQTGKPDDFLLKVAAKPVDDAEAQKRWPWAVEGVVTDDAGQPLQGVEIRAATGMGTLRTTMPVISDAQGRYFLRFGPGMMMKNDKTGKWGAGVQAAIISARKAGYAEKNLGHQGDLLMADTMPDEKQKGNHGVVLAGKPYRVDFVLVPPAVVEGRVVDEKGDLLPDIGIYLTGNVLPPASSILSQLSIDGEGRFHFDAVPPGFAWWFQGGVGGIALSRTQPVTFAQGGTYKVELRVISQGDTGKMLRIASVKDSQGNELLEKVVGDDPRARPLVDAQTAAKAREILARVAEVNRYWLAAPSKNITAFSYTFHLKGQNPREITYQDYLNGTSWYPEWYGKGISYTGAARVLTSLRNKAKFHELKIGDKQISIYFVLEGLPSTVAAGNGIAGTWNGFVQGMINEGRIVLDAKRLTPISIECGRNKERYDDYVEIGPSWYVPLYIDIERAGMEFHWKFRVWKPGLWLFDRTQNQSGTEASEPVAWTTNVTVNGQPAVPAVRK